MVNDKIGLSEIFETLKPWRILKMTNGKIAAAAKETQNSDVFFMFEGALTAWVVREFEPRKYGFICKAFVESLLVIGKKVKQQPCREKLCAGIIQKVSRRCR